MAILLKTELPSLGCPLSPESFREIVRRTFEDSFGGITDEDLLFNPEDAVRFCKLVRQYPGCRKLTDELILRTLINWRKNKS